MEDYNPQIKITLGDITQTRVDAIMTAINPAGMWFGGVDRAIERVAGGMYHAQAAARMPLKNLDVIVAKGDRREHGGQFNDVVFVVDALESPVSQVVYKGLEAAHEKMYNSIAFPAVRMGVMAGVKEKTPKETVRGIGEGISLFQKEYGLRTGLRDLIFVVFRDMQAVGYLQHGFKSQHLLN